MENDPLELIRHTGAFFIPKGAITSELHLAAFLQVPRDTVIDQLIYPEPDGEAPLVGIDHMKVGNRHVFTSDAAYTVVDRLAKPHARPRRKGGATRRTPSKKPK